MFIYGALVLASALALHSCSAMVMQLPTRRQLLRVTVGSAGGFLASGASLERASAEDRARYLDVCPNCPQAEPPFKFLPSIRGRWSLRYTLKSTADTTTVGEVAFRGFDSSPNKGSAIYASADGESSATGTWLEKPAGLRDGQVSWSARWKLRFPTGTLIFRGDTRTPPGDFLTSRTPTIPEGDVLVTVVGIGGALAERKIGRFDAQLIESWRAGGTGQGML